MNLTKKKIKYLEESCKLLGSELNSVSAEYEAQSKELEQTKAHLKSAEKALIYKENHILKLKLSDKDTIIEVLRDRINFENRTTIRKEEYIDHLHTTLGRLFCCFLVVSLFLIYNLLCI